MKNMKELAQIAFDEDIRHVLTLEALSDVNEHRVIDHDKVVSWLKMIE